MTIFRQYALRSALRLAPLAVGIAFVTGCQQDGTRSTENTGVRSAATQTVAVPVEGMICQICAGRVKSTLKAVHGVDDVEISLEKRNAVIRYDASSVSPEQLARAINELGYKTGAPTPASQ